MLVGTRNSPNFLLGVFFDIPIYCFVIVTNPQPEILIDAYIAISDSAISLCSIYETRDLLKNYNNYTYQYLNRHTRNSTILYGSWNE